MVCHYLGDGCDGGDRSEGGMGVDRVDRLTGMTGMTAVRNEGGGKILADERTDGSIEASTRGPRRPI